MIPARRWRRLALAGVAVADLVVVLVVTVSSPDLLLFVVPLLLALTARSAFVPEGWAPHGLVFTQVGAYAMAVTAPRAGLDWALAVLTGLAVLATHLCLSLLAAWPPRAGLPSATAGRTATAFGVVGAVTGIGGLLAGLAGATPDTWAEWLVPVAVVTLAGLLWALRGAYRPAVGR